MVPDLAHLAANFFTPRWSDGKYPCDSLCDSPDRASAGTCVQLPGSTDN